MQKEKVDLKKLYFIFPKPAERDRDLISKGLAPSERLYGMLELEKIGYNTKTNSHIYSKDGRLSRALKFFRIPRIDFQMLKDMASSDTIIVKDDINIIYTLIAKLLLKKIIYKDSLFQTPRNKLRVIYYWLNFLLADDIIVYSKHQVKIWSQLYKRFSNKFSFIYYPIDIEFYRKGIKNSKLPKDSVLATGRDPGRDFLTLIKATKNNGCSIDLVTLPYLIPKNYLGDSDVRVWQNISYEELFSLYATAFVSAVPLKEAIDYPSGIRAVMESAAINVPVITTYTEILEEYFNKEDVLYCKPVDEGDLSQKISFLKSNKDLAVTLSDNAFKQVQNYSIENYASEFSKFIEK